MSNILEFVKFIFKGLLTKLQQWVRDTAASIFRQIRLLLCNKRMSGGIILFFTRSTKTMSYIYVLRKAYHRYLEYPLKPIGVFCPKGSLSYTNVIPTHLCGPPSSIERPWALWKEWCPSPTLLRRVKERILASPTPSSSPAERVIAPVGLVDSLCGLFSAMTFSKEVNRRKELTRKQNFKIKLD